MAKGHIFLIPESAFFVLHGTALLPPLACPGSEMAKRTPLSYCTCRQGQSDLNGWPWAAALQALIFPSAWPSGLEDEPSSERIMSISSEDLEQRQSGGGEIRTQKSHVPVALAHMICCPCLGSFSLSLFLREMVKCGDKAVMIWRWDGPWEEMRAVWSHTWPETVPITSCSQVMSIPISPSCPRLARMGKKAWVPDKLSSPSRCLAGSCGGGG